MPWGFMPRTGETVQPRDEEGVKSRSAKSVIYFATALNLWPVRRHPCRKQGSPMLVPRGKAGDQNSAGRRPGAQDDALLIRRVAGGDARAFEALYRIYHPRLTRFLTNIL